MTYLKDYVFLFLHSLTFIRSCIQLLNQITSSFMQNNKNHWIVSYSYCLHSFVYYCSFGSCCCFMLLPLFAWYIVLLLTRTAFHFFSFIIVQCVLLLLLFRTWLNSRIYFHAHTSITTNICLRRSELSVCLSAWLSWLAKLVSVCLWMFVLA